jgi:hypothetical protein
MHDKSHSITEALDRMREVLAASLDANRSGRGDDGGRCGVAGDPSPFEYWQVRNGQAEQVLVFNNDQYIALKGVPLSTANVPPEAAQDLPPDRLPYFSAHGTLTDLFGNVLRGSRVETTVPIDPQSLSETAQWPPSQPWPFDQPPLDATHALVHTYAKHVYFFNDTDSLVTVGPSLPKIARLKSGGAQFWVGTIGVITQGTGKFAGARGQATYAGSSYFKDWPASFPDQAKILAAGFKALVGTCFKVVLNKELAG